MSEVESPSAQRPYGLARVCRIWKLPRSSAQLMRHQRLKPAAAQPSRRPGPRNILSDDEILAAIRTAIEASLFVGEGHRTIWARMRHAGVRTTRRRVLRLIGEHSLLAPSRQGAPPGPRTHDGTIVSDRPDSMWGIDATSTLTLEPNTPIHLSNEPEPLHVRFIRLLGDRAGPPPFASPHPPRWPHGRRPPAAGGLHR